MNSASPLIEVEKLEAWYGRRRILRDVDFSVNAGEIRVIMGGSGSGKSTLLRHLLGLHKPRSGAIRLLGVDIARASPSELLEVRRKIGVSFQGGALLTSMTVGENVALPLHEHTHLSEAEIRKVVMDALDSVGLSHTFDNLPSELSGGMLKRAGFARAIVTRPELILYDEPTTGLDPIVTHLITDIIVKLRQKLNGTAVVISHDLQSIFMMADYVAMLFEGAIIAYDTAAGIKKSMNPIVQQFLQGSEVGPIPI
jgi:phospholipid/cholesterol/gamma-HCH transport system ATP-binding protein